MAEEFKIKSKEEKISALNDLMGDMNKLNSMSLKEHSTFIKEALGGSIPTFDDVNSVRKYQEFIKDKVSNFVEGSLNVSDVELPHMAAIVKSNRNIFQDQTTKSDAFYNNAMLKIQGQAQDMLATPYRMEKLQKADLQAFADTYIEASRQDPTGKKTFDGEIRRRLDFMKELEPKTPLSKEPLGQIPDFGAMEYSQLRGLYANSSNDDLKKQIEIFAAAKVQEFASGTTPIKNSEEYKLVYHLIQDPKINGSAQNGEETANKAQQAFSQLRGFKNVTSGEVEFYDPRSGKTIEEFKAEMIAPPPVTGSPSDKEVEDKKELSGGTNQVDAEKMQEQIANILSSRKDLDESALESLKEEIVAHVKSGGDISKYKGEVVAEKTNEEKELDKSTTDENNLGAELDDKKFSIDAPVENVADKTKKNQISEAMLAQEDKNWKKYADENNVLSESVKQENAIVTKIFSSEAEKKKGEHSAVVERTSEHSANVYGKDKKEPDLKIFQALVKGAKESGHSSINLAKDLSKEAKEKAIIASLQQEMKLVQDGKAASIDMKQDYVKRLDKETRKKIKQYNLSIMTNEERDKYNKDQKLLKLTGRKLARPLRSKKSKSDTTKSLDEKDQQSSLQMKKATEILGGPDR